ncbi:hypothetical protein HDU96_005112 [Phlyctochytrium bullatum]|nr:hypothetical protein HDU96_005112 [Phlyctochytrium bullatum]
MKAALVASIAASFAASGLAAAPQLVDLSARTYLPKCGVNVAKTPFAIFDPPTLTVSDFEFASNFTVKLAKKPSADVKLYLDAKGLSFSKNTLEFSPDNWDTPQPLAVISNPDVYQEHASASVKIVAQADAPCEKYSACEQTLEGKRVFVPGGCCLATGDPHFKTFSGLSYDNQLSGTFYLLRSDFLRVQIYQNPCVVIRNLKATCVSAVAIQYGDSAAIVSTTNKYDSVDFRKFGQPSLTRLSEDLDDLDYSPKNAARSSQWKLVLKDGTVINVITASGGNMGAAWLDVSVTLQSGYYNKVGGLCSAHTGDLFYKDKLVCSDGRAFSHNSKKPDQKKVDEFAESWRVPDTENLFKGAYKPSDVPARPIAKHITPVKGCKPPVFNTCTPKTTSTTVRTTEVVPTSSSTTVLTTNVTPVTPSSSSTTFLTTHVTPVTPSSSSTTFLTTEVTPVTPSSSSTTVRTTEVTPVTPSSSSTTVLTTEVTPVTPTSSSTTTVSTSVVPITSTSTTTTKTPCTVPVYVPDDHVCTNPPATSTTAVVTSTVVPVASTSTSTEVAPVVPTTTVSYSTGTVVIPIATEVPYGGFVPVPGSGNQTYHIPQPPTYLSEDEVKKAEKTCQELVVPKGCDKVCPNELAHYLRSCVSDILTLGTYTFCESTRQAVNALCETLTGYMADTDKPEVVKQAEEIRKDLGYGDEHKCKNDCSGRGECKQGGCVCRSPFTGADCSVDPVSLPPAPYYAAPSGIAVVPAATGKAPAAAPVYGNSSLVDATGNVKPNVYYVAPAPTTTYVKAKATTTAAAFVVPAASVYNQILPKTTAAAAAKTTPGSNLYQNAGERSAAASAVMALVAVAAAMVMF